MKMLQARHDIEDRLTDDEQNNANLYSPNSSVIPFYEGPKAL